MTARIPVVKFFRRRSPNKSGDGSAGKIAVIGAFNTTETDPTLFTTVDKALHDLGSDTTFDGCTCIEPLFANGATSLLAVNITTWSSATPPVPTKTVTADNLATALAKIKGEDWDMLFVCAPITSAFETLIDQYLDATWEMQYPAGYVGALTGEDSANIALAAGAGDHCYGLIPNQAWKVNDTQLTVLQTAAYYCGLLAGMSVGNTMTMKQVPGVTGVSPELSFESGGAGKALLEAGLTTVKCRDRNTARYVVMNSEQPNGLDLYVNRVRDYVVKQLALHDFLGERNREATLDEITHEVMRVKELCVNTLDLLRDIEFDVEKKSGGLAEVHLTKLLFDEILTEIDVYVTVEVE